MSRKATPVAEATSNDEVVEATETEEITFSAKDLAAELGIDPKSFRRWLRAHTAERANKGGRWVFTAEAKAQFLDAYRSKGTEPTLEAEVLDDSEVAELDEVELIDEVD